MDKVQMKEADRVLADAVSDWWAGRLEKDPAIREAADTLEALCGDHAEDASSLLCDIFGRAADMVAEAALKKVL